MSYPVPVTGLVFDLSEGMENFKMSGKSQGILRWMISGNPGILIEYISGQNILKMCLPHYQIYVFFT